MLLGGPVRFESAAVLQAWGASAGKIQCLLRSTDAITVQQNSFGTACWKERRALSWRLSDPRQPFSSHRPQPLLLLPTAACNNINVFLELGEALRVVELCARGPPSVALSSSANHSAN